MSLEGLVPGDLLVSGRHHISLCDMSDNVPVAFIEPNTVCLVIASFVVSAHAFVFVMSVDGSFGWCGASRFKRIPP